MASLINYPKYTKSKSFENAAMDFDEGFANLYLGNNGVHNPLSDDAIWD